MLKAGDSMSLWSAGVRQGLGAAQAGIKVVDMSLSYYASVLLAS